MYTQGVMIMEQQIDGCLAGARNFSSVGGDGQVGQVGGHGQLGGGGQDIPDDKGMGGRCVDFLYTICRYIATIHTDIVDKLTRSVEIVSKKNGHYFLNQHYLYKDQLYLLVRQDLLK